MTGGEDLRTNVIDQGLCTRCGGCVASCPVDALSFTRNGIELTGDCIDCGNCYAICPGMGVDLSSHEKRLFGRSRKRPLGSKKGIYLKRTDLSAGDRKIYRSGYFGGRVTATCIHGLENGFFDAVLMTDWSRTGDLSIGKGVIARTRDEVLSCSSSKYVFTPVLSLLKDINKDDTIKKVAVVGLPCHFHALRNMEMEPGTKHLTEKVEYAISLNCGAANLDESKWRTTISKLTRVKGDDIAGFSARKTSGSTIRFTVKKNDGAVIEKDLALSKYMLTIASVGVWRRCLMCPDYSGDLSDITFGAPVIRTAKGMKLIRSALESGDLVKSKTKRKTSQYFLDLIIPIRKRNRTLKNIKKRKKEGMKVPIFR